MKEGSRKRPTRMLVRGCLHRVLVGRVALTKKMLSDILAPVPCPPADPSSFHVDFILFSANSLVRVHVATYNMCYIYGLTSLGPERDKVLRTEGAKSSGYTILPTMGVRIQ